MKLHCPEIVVGDHVVSYGTPASLQQYYKYDFL